MDELFSDEMFYTGPPLNQAAVARAEADLGVRLPKAYAEALLRRNGGELRRQCHPTPFPTSWAPDHFKVLALLGIGGEWGIDSTAEAGSAYLIAEWGYPEIGVVIAETPSAGHDTVMLDYTACGQDGEPSVVYVDDDRVPRKVADTFAEFLANLSDCAGFEA